MKQHRFFQILLAGAFILGLSQVLPAQEKKSELSKVKWQEGPSIANLGSIAEVHVPGGYVFAGGDDTRLLMEAMQNPQSGQELGLLGPAGLDWFIVFEFDEVGFVRDDEKAELDADAMLESIKKATEEGNKERAQRGWPAMTIVGWQQEHKYDATTNNLEWAIKGMSEQEVVTNYNTRLLGRRGVMRVTLVCDPAALDQTLPKFRQTLDGFKFKPGQKYAEFTKGDKVAEYGLTALVTGGAAAVAAKTGLLKWLWKGIVVVGAAVVAAVRRLFSRDKSA